MDEVRVGRAAFLTTIGLGALGVAFGSRVTSALHSPINDVGSVVPSGLKALLPTGGWRIYSINPPWPVFHPATYKLTVSGLVEKPAVLSWDEISNLPTVKQVSTFHCVTGWTVGNVHWEGVQLQTLWDMVQPMSTAKYINFVSMEKDYVDTLSLPQSLLPHVMLAHTMDGKPLPREHGAPLRLIIPEMYGYKNVKWVHKLELVPTLHPGFWEQNGYDVDAWVGRSNGY
jgi:DMSO/TMAO reductase YedYZ molybdopterin-dependent catalytic subunit